MEKDGFRSRVFVSTLLQYHMSQILILVISSEVCTMTGKRVSESDIITAAETHLAKNYAWVRGFIPQKAHGCWIWDRKGMRFLDMVACYSVLNFGHNHPAIREAIDEALDTGLVACPGFILTEERALLAKELVEFCGMEDATALFIVSGAEGVETAMKIARKWAYVKKGVPQKKAKIIFCRNNFHGRTIGVISASTTPQYKDGFGPFLPGIKTISFGDITALERAITNNTAAFFVEPVQGEGGVNVPPPGYLNKVRRLCSLHNVLMVCDEVQTGFGRTGTVLSCDRECVKPDLLILGKALGGGMPISAVVGRRDVMDVLSPGDHGSTFGGNPMACHVARRILRLMNEIHPEINAEIEGVYIKDKLEKMASSFDFIKDVRGLGLLIGIEFTKNGPTAHKMCEELFREGIIAKDAKERVLRISPPLTISRGEVDWALRGIQRAFEKISSRRKKK